LDIHTSQNMLGILSPDVETEVRYGIQRGEALDESGKALRARGFSPRKWRYGCKLGIVRRSLGQTEYGIRAQHLHHLSK